MSKVDKRYVTVLDFECGEVFQYEIDTLDIPIGETIHEWYEEFLRNKGHNIASIEWMEHPNNRIIKEEDE